LLTCSLLACSGKLEEDGKTYWDMKQRKVMTIVTPNFSTEVDPSYMCKVNGNGVEVMPPGAQFWEDAIEKLERHACTLPHEP
jgi:hypothetical protein